MGLLRKRRHCNRFCKLNCESGPNFVRAGFLLNWMGPLSDCIAVFPLAVPSIASPVAMLAAALLTENSQYSLVRQAQTTAIMCLVLLVVLVLMLLATRVHRLIGNSGASIVSRVMGLILTSVAVANVLAGTKEYFAI